jgi:hypothetical protein
MYTGSNSYHHDHESKQDDSDKHSYYSSFNVEAILHSTEYKEWTAIREKCTNPENVVTSKICKDWFLSFSKFLDDMGIAPLVNNEVDGVDAKYVIERIDESKPYCAENCSWTLCKPEIPAFKHHGGISFAQQKSSSSQPAYPIGSPPQHTTLQPSLKDTLDLKEKSKATNKCKLS